MTRLLLMSVLALAALAPQAYADNYPCGPDGMPLFLKRLVPQGAYGADFRPACRSHDACYGSGASRKQCDQQFRSNMHAACNCSRHPILCRMAANHRYRMVRLFGGSAYRR